MSLIGQQRFLKPEENRPDCFLWVFFLEEFARGLGVGWIQKQTTSNMQIPVTLPQIERTDPLKEK